MTKQIILFDLGGVLVNTVGRVALKRLSPEISDAEIIERWSRSRAVDEFESGRCGEQAFAEMFLAEWKIPLSATAFLEEFARWIDGYLDGALALVDELSSRHRVGCLSNTNAIHWRAMTELTDRFHFRFASHNIGFMKPDPRIYQHVMENLDARPQDIYFFDDLNANVEAAAALGINAFHVDGPCSVNTILRRNALLPPIAS